MHLFDLPLFYDIWSRLYLPAVARAVHDVIGDTGGSCMLDLGCGTGRLKAYLPQVAYTGIDLNPRYIAYARRNYNGRFIAGDVLDLGHCLARADFDCILLNGILHHIDFGRAKVLMSRLPGYLRPEGRVIVIDHVTAPGLSLINRLLLYCDRGAFIRDKDSYTELFQTFRVCMHGRVVVRLGPVTICSSFTRYVLQKA
jgi:SAM-dependent methyltransferase